MLKLPEHPGLKKHYPDTLALLLIFTVTLLALFFKIGEIPPPYPWSDESEIAADAVATLRYGPQLFYPDQLAGGSLAVWLEAGWMALAGPSLIGLRLLNGLINVTTALVLYLLVQRLPLKLEPPAHRWLALTAALLLGMSTWFWSMARIAAPNWALVALLTTVAFYFFWLGLESGQIRYPAAAGALLGLQFYGYFPGYLAPVVPVLFVAIPWAMRPRETSARSGLRTLACLLPVMVGVAAPMATYFILNPAAILQRPLQLADTQELEGITALGQGVLDTLLAFGIWPAWLLQGRFTAMVFDPLVTVLFVAGLLIALRRWREPAWLFGLIWWLVMVSPAMLSRSASTGFAFETWRRGVGAQPVSFIFPALTLVTLARHLPGLNSGKKMLPFLAIGVLLISTGLNYRLYFQEWAASPHMATAFAKSPVQLVDWLNRESRPTTLFLWPRRPHVSPTTRPELFTVRYLYNGPAEVAFPEMDEATVNQTMADLLNGPWQQVTLFMPTRLEVDPKGYFDYLLTAQGRLVSRQTLPGYTATTYTVTHPQPPNTALEPADKMFGGAVQLTGRQIWPTSPSAGQTVGIALRWLQPNAAAADYNVRVNLSDRQGFDLGALDKPLLSNQVYATTRHWLPGTESTVYLALPIPPDTPPGQVTLAAVVYNAQTGERLQPGGGQADLSLPLAQLEIRPNPTVLDAAGLSITRPLNRELPGGVILVGIQNSAKAVNRPGDEVQMSLWWQTMAPPPKNLGLRLRLVQPDGVVVWTGLPQPILTRFPVTAWLPRQIYRGHYALRLPAALATADYRLTVQMIDPATAEVIGEEMLFALPVTARTPVPAAPMLEHRLERDFGQFVRLRSFSVNLRPADKLLAVALQWQVLQEIPAVYKVFLHLTNANGDIVAQLDTLPTGEKVLTTGWIPGEIIADEFLLNLPVNLPPGQYRLLAGLYNQQSGQRLFTGQNDHIVLFETAWPGTGN